MHSDVPTKEFILSLNDAKATNQKFVIAELGDTRLFVQPRITEWLQQKCQEMLEKNSYQPPRET